MKTSLILLLISSCLVGIADAGYLTWQKMQGLVPPCSAQFQCEAVLDSQWAHVGPVPVSAMGILFYSCFIVLGITYFLGVEQLSIKQFQIPLRFLLFGWGVIGMLFSLYLVTIMAFILKAWCVYCLISALNSLILFVLSASIFYVSRKKSV